MKYFNKSKTFIKNLVIADDQHMRSELPIQQSLRITKIFYGLALIITSMITVNILHRLEVNSGQTWLWPLSWLRLFSAHQIFYIQIMLVASALASCSYSLLSPQTKIPKILFAVFFTLLLALFFSQGKLNHKLHVYMYASYFMPFLNCQMGEVKNNRYNFLVLQSVLAVSLLSYFLSGLWKVRSFFHSLFTGVPFNEFAQNLSYQMSLNIIEGTSKTPVMEWAMTWPILIQFSLWSAVIYFELSCLIVPWRPSIYRTWAFLFACFHFGTALLFKIPFYETQVLIIFLLLSMDKSEIKIKESFFLLPLFNTFGNIIRTKVRNKP